MTYNRDAVLERAMQLFWDSGYEATSMRDLVAVMDLSRSSFYQGFGGKRDLFVSCLERYEQQTSEMLWEQLAGAESARGFIHDTLSWATAESAAGTGPRGCLVMNTATEFAQRDPAIATVVTRGLDEYRAIFEAAVQRGQEEGSIRTDRSAAAQANYLVTTMSGLRTMVKAGTNVTALTEMVTVAMDAVTN